MRCTWSLRLALCAFVMATAAVPAAAQLVDVPLPKERGLSVTPSFEGWFKNADGTFSLSFGYLNRNRVEELDIPIGPNNRIEPGPPDQGQPTHFAVRRHAGVFTVTVPADFGNKKVTWTLVSHGETISIPGTLRPEWQIDALKEVTSGNTPPSVRFEPEGKRGQGPTGIRTRIEARRNQPASIQVWVSDDGIGKKREGRQNAQADGVPAQDATQKPDAGQGVIWYKFRGPGVVTFGNTEPEIGKDGKAVTTATFGEPGEYVLRVLAWDASGKPARGVMAVGFQCCWTNAYVEVAVR